MLASFCALVMRALPDVFDDGEDVFLADLSRANALFVVPEGDVDVYRVDVPRPGKLNVVVDDVPADTGIRAELYNADFRRMDGSQSVNHGATVRFDEPVAPGSYQVHISRGGDWPVAGRGEPPYRYSRPYRLTVTLD